MQIYVSNKELEQIADGLIQTIYSVSMPDRIDIDGIAKYLGLSVIYEHIAEDDKDKIGFVSNGCDSVYISRGGQKQSVVFPKNTVVLDSFLRHKDEEHRRRFVLAHEIGHVLIGRADPIKIETCFNRTYDTERQYNIDKLRERLNLCEYQANSMAAMLLMPRYLLTNAVQRYFRRKKIPVYGDCVFMPNIKLPLQKMSDEICVSHTAMIIQLRKYGLLEQHSMDEYFKKTMTISV